MAQKLFSFRSEVETFWAGLEPKVFTSGSKTAQFWELVQKFRCTSRTRIVQLEAKNDFGFQSKTKNFEIAPENGAAKGRVVHGTMDDPPLGRFFSQNFGFFFGLLLQKCQVLSFFDRKILKKFWKAVRKWAGW